MKPGELERTLSRLVEVARAARERLAGIERELAELRRDMENLASQAGGALEGHEVTRRDQTSRSETDRSGREAGSE